MIVMILMIIFWLNEIRSVPPQVRCCLSFVLLWKECFCKESSFHLLFFFFLNWRFLDLFLFIFQKIVYSIFCRRCFSIYFFRRKLLSNKDTILILFLLLFLSDIAVGKMHFSITFITNMYVIGNVCNYYKLNVEENYLYMNFTAHFINL